MIKYTTGRGGLFDIKDIYWDLNRTSKREQKDLVL